MAKKEDKKAKFTAIYDWLAERPDLNSTEKILIAHILRFGRSGCFKSNNRLAHDLGMDRVTVIRAIKGLIDSEWIAPLYETRHNRILFVSEVRLDDMPLFAGGSGSGATQQGSGATQQGSGATPPPFNRNSKDLSYIEKRVLNEVNFAASTMKERTGKSTADQFERRRQQLHRQLEEKT